LLVNKIPLGPPPKIFPEFVGLLFFHLLSAQETIRKPHAVEADEMTRKSEGNHPAFHGDAKFVEENVQPPSSTFSVG